MILRGVSTWALTRYDCGLLSLVVVVVVDIVDVVDVNVWWSDL